MGSGGGRRYDPVDVSAVQKKLEQARKEERERVERDVDEFLRETLAQLNDRDTELTQERIDQVQELLGEETQIDALLFGGSVVKHTYVDGLSDIDALVVLDRPGTRGLSPEKMIASFCETLKSRLPGKDVERVEAGRLAATVHFRDGTEVQLLPAVRSGKKLAIPGATGKGWNKTDPRVFTKALSRENAKSGGGLVPAIKLFKSLVSGLPRQQTVSGYHAEAMAVEAMKGYSGAYTPRAILSRILEHSTQRVLRPIADRTGQSRTVDASLGVANSHQRRLVSHALAGILRRLNGATSVSQWRAIFEG